MFSMTLAGVCALVSQVLGTWGNLAQIQLNHRRQSTEGLSFFYWESRVWSKLPWFAFIFSLKSIDYSLMGSIALALIPPFIILHQFVKYQPRVDSILWKRVKGQYLLLGIALFLAILAREQISALGVLLSILPVVCAFISVGIGGLAQFRCNYLRGNGDAVAGERYQLLVVSNLLWLAYGISKGLEMGWSESWTICCCSALGASVYTLLSLQYLLFARKKESSGGEPIPSLPRIPAIP